MVKYALSKCLIRYFGSAFFMSICILYKDERERMSGMYGKITKYMGTAYTGLGIAHKYDELIASATETIFLKCPPTTALSTLLNDTALHYIKRGFDVDKLMSPTQSDETDAIFVKELNILYLQASHPVALEPTNLGGHHRVISFYDIYDEQKLQETNKSITGYLSTAEDALDKTLQSLAEAKKIHDEWEEINIERMIWQLHEALIDSLKEELFSTIILNKKSEVAHRLIGSLTSGGATDYIASITHRMERRMLIKGLAGTGKSTIMKALGEEAERRGFDVLYGWCGLDPTGVDLVLFPELSICLFDATKPHEYGIERKGDEIVDLLPMCADSEEAEKLIEAIEQIYREKILDATGYMQAYAQAEKQMKVLMDGAIKETVFQEKSKKLIDIN